MGRAGIISVCAHSRCMGPGDPQDGGLVRVGNCVLPLSCHVSSLFAFFYPL